MKMMMMDAACTNQGLLLLLLLLRGIMITQHVMFLSLLTFCTR